jgi:hypothetical protein
LSGSDRSLEDLNTGLSYLLDSSIYASVLPPLSVRQVQRAVIPTNYTEHLLAAGIFEPANPKHVRGSLFVFSTPEFAKKRRRIIQHTKAINESVPAAPSCSFNTIKYRCQLVHSGSVAGQVDFKAYYTQFPLDPSLRDFFCAKLPVADPLSDAPSWKLFRLCVAPTGMSHMVFTACMATARLKDFAHRSAAHDDQIDNVLFVGEPDDVVSDLTTLSTRCDFAGVTINENVADPRSLISDSIDWCGLHLDFRDKTVSLTTKVSEKTRFSWSGRTQWSWRGFAAHVGLLFYGAQVIDVPVARYFNLLRFVSHVGYSMQAAGDTLWDSPAEVWPSASADLEAWTAHLLSNNPRLVPKRLDPDILVLVDSSSFGWGYVALDLFSGLIFTHGAPWSSEFVNHHGADKLLRSAFTEPHGLLLMKRHLIACLSTSSRRSFVVGSDSVTAIATFRRGFASRSFDLNSVALQDRSSDDITRHQWDYVHVPGKKNTLADAFSRGLSPSLSPEDLLGLEASLRDCWGLTRW